MFLVPFLVFCCLNFTLKFCDFEEEYRLKACIYFIFFHFVKRSVKMSSQGHDSSGSNHSDSSQEDYKPEDEHDEENEETDSKSIDIWLPDPLAIDCPSTLLAKRARGS